MGEGGNSEEDLPSHELASVWACCLNPRKFWKRDVGNLGESGSLSHLPLLPLHTLTFGSMESSRAHSLMVHTLSHTRYAVHFYGTFEGFAESQNISH